MQIDRIKFTVTQQHLDLLYSAYVGWCDDEFGAPCIDPKRPYGNSDVVSDMCDILDIPYDYDKDFGGLGQAGYAKMVALHKDLITVLQIVLCTGKFEAGTYIRDSYDHRDWVQEGGKFKFLCLYHPKDRSAPIANIIVSEEGVKHWLMSFWFGSASEREKDQSWQSWMKSLRVFFEHDNATTWQNEIEGGMVIVQKVVSNG